MPETVSRGRPPTDVVELEVDGRQVTVPATGTLLDALRDELGVRSVKDGCSPQGQCGCCTVLVDGAARVACVTPVRRVAGRQITTLDGLAPEVADAWVDAFVTTGASQCGFCTPGIIVRLESLRTKGVEPGDHEAVGRGLAAHLCRCTGWQTITEAWDAACPVLGGSAVGAPGEPPEDRSGSAGRRAEIEGHGVQHVGPDVVRGRGGFADDVAPAGALVAVTDGAGGWAVGETLAEARVAAGKQQGRRTTLDPVPPLALPDGDWAITLRTAWVEPGYLETDASWCEPGGEPASPLGNGGAFGGKVTSIVPAVARRLADEHGRAVRVLLSREDTVLLGPKRPPIAAGLRGDGGGILRAVRTAGLADRVRVIAPEIEVEEVDVAGPPTSLDLRGAVWAELALLRAGLATRVGSPPAPVVGPSGAVAEAEVVDGRIRVRVSCGAVLDEVVLRSYCIGAAHMGWSWVTSEGLAVANDGTIGDLTVRSFGIVRALDTPPIDVEIDRSDAARAAEPVNGSDAVFAAVAAATWISQGCPTDLPTQQGNRR